MSFIKGLSILAVVLVTTFNSPHSQAQGSGNSGGGDVDGMEAALQLGLVIQDLQKLSTKIGLNEKQVQLVKAQAGKILILMVDQSLPASVGGATQMGSAYSQQGERTSLCLIHRAAWKNETDIYKRKSLLAHEIFVVTGIESTGDYSHSNQYALYARSNPGVITPSEELESYLNPGVENGESYLVRYDGYSTGDPKAYGQLMMQCRFNYRCTTEKSVNLITAISNPNGICVSKGFQSAVKWATGVVKNPFGTEVTIDKNAQMIDLLKKKTTPVVLRRGYSVPAGRGFLYVDDGVSVYTSITCRK